MSTITAIQAQKRRRDRVNIFVDGQYAFALSLEVAASLHVGQEMTVALQASLEAGEELERARQRALKLISFRPRSSAEVRQQLRRHQTGEAVIDQTIARLEQAGLLDDLAFARYWIEQRETFKPRGAMALRQELRQKGVAEAIIEASLAGIDELESARRAAAPRAARLAHLSQEQFRQKLGRFLQQRGFGYDLIRPVVRELWAANHENQPAGPGHPADHEERS